MAYKALYRTYRPADFNEIAGQEHITKTFRNALKNNKIAHAYLFSGPRGTGKTSIAKIIAKAVNCEKAPIENPCNECDICRGIDNNTISDVIEIDAASNNGVDEIREIRDKVKYLPGVGKYKVYIIDEVHMLSTGAFNALLKTLEEPPKHVIFILATTEPHKIPATIHSRCQRFDFRGVSVPEMIHRLNTIIDEEHIQIEKEAIKVIAEAAEGGMRDAISLLDQVVSYTDEAVCVEDVHAIKGTVSNEKLLTIAQSIYQNNSVEAINQLDELIALGKEAPRLVENLIKFYKDMLIYKNVDTLEDDQLIYSEEAFVVLSNSLSNNMIFYYIDVLNKAQNDMKWSTNAKLYMELALIKMVDKVEKQEIIIDDEIRLLSNKINDLQEQLDTKQFQQVVPTAITEPIQEEKQSISSILEQDETTKPIQEDYIEPTYVESDEEENPEESFSDIEDETVIEQPLIVESEEQEDTLFDFEQDEDPKSYKTYDIRYVEDVLNNGDREVKIDMVKKWYDLERFVKPSDLPMAKTITSGNLVATNGRQMIIEYPSAAYCNRMMKKDNKEKAEELISAFFNREIDYMALPHQVWQEKSTEYIKLWREQKSNNQSGRIRLSEINHPELIELETVTHETEDMTPDSVRDAINLFGKDAVTVKKGE